MDKTVDSTQELKDIQAHLLAIGAIVERLSGSPTVQPPTAYGMDEISHLKARWQESEKRANAAEAKLSKLLREVDHVKSQAKESVHRIEQLAFKDEITGLANQHLVREHLSRMATQASLDNQVFLLLVDIDRFEVINGVFGHSCGDELLKRVGERICEVIPGNIAVGRMSEDEFALVLGGISARQLPNLAAQLAQEVSNALSSGFSVQGQTIHLTVSQGGSAMPLFAQDTSQLLEQARSALSLAKGSGRARWCIFDPALQQHQQQQESLEYQLRFGLSNREFFPVFQPIYSMESKDNRSLQGRVVGAEVLARWNHRVAGVLEPESFLKPANRSGHIVAIGKMVIEQACVNMKEWVDHGLELFLSVNLSARQLLEKDLLTTLLEALTKHSLEPHNVCLEFDESFGTLDEEQIEQTIHSLIQAEFPLAIDRYGDGASSLQMLESACFLKLSEELVQLQPLLCAKAIKLAQTLDLMPIAVGVESKEHALRLLNDGCTLMQGHFMSEPVTASDFKKLCAHSPIW